MRLRRPAPNVLLLLTFALATTAAPAQDMPKAQHDSLWAIWRDPSKADTARLAAIYGLIWDDYRFSQPDSAIHYAWAQYEFARVSGSKKYMARAYNALGRIHSDNGDYEKAIESYGMRLQLEQEMGDRAGMGSTLNRMGIAHMERDHYAPALSCFARSLTAYREIDHVPGVLDAINNIGTVFDRQARYAEALRFYGLGLSISKLAGSEQDVAVELLNMAGINTEQGDLAKATVQLSDALTVFEQAGDLKGAAIALNNLGNIYNEQGESATAIKHYERSMAIQEKLGNELAVAVALSNIGIIHKERNDLDSALAYYTRSLHIREEFGDRRGVANCLSNIGEVHMLKGEIDTALAYHSRGLSISEEIRDPIGMSISLKGIGRIRQDRSQHAEAIALGTRALALANEVGDVVSIERTAEFLYENYKALGRDAQALKMFELHVRMRDSLDREENHREVIRHEYKYEYEKRETVLQAEQEKKDAIAAQELRRRKLQRNAFIGGFGLTLLLAVTFLVQRNRVNKARKRSDELLLNILPEEVAEELKDTGAAQAKHFDRATILFTDFRGFTQVSEKLTPQELVQELDTCFSAFDRIIDGLGIEKIKVIGDSYMCAGGLPDPGSSSPADVVRAALEMQAFIEARHAARDAQGLPAFRMRVGIHTGPVVAGIVGVKKFQYDIWGDTVNTASRMESSGEVGQVNISEATYAQVKNETGLSFTPRGRVQAKGKGNMEMYFVHRISGAA